MPIFFFLKDHLSFCCTNFQRSVQPVPHFVTFNIVSRCFQSINNNCCKNAICLLFTNILATLLLRRLSCRVVSNGFVNSNHFCKVLFLKNYCFYIQNIWIQCWMLRIVIPVEQNFANYADCYLGRRCWLLLAPHNNWCWFAPSNSSNEIRQAEMIAIGQHSSQAMTSPKMAGQPTNDRAATTTSTKNHPAGNTSNLEIVVCPERKCSHCFFSNFDHHFSRPISVGKLLGDL